MILGPSQNEPNIVWHSGAVTREHRKTRGMTLWLTGLSGSGKSSVAVEIERRLVAAGQPAYILDGDNLRHGLNSDLGFSPEDRQENVRRVAEVARLIADAGVVAIVSLVSPYRADRDAARAAHEADGLPFLEIFMDTPLEVAEARDTKGLYAKARAGEITDFTGINAPYEAPMRPDLLLRPERRRRRYARGNRHRLSREARSEQERDAALAAELAERAGALLLDLQRTSGLTGKELGKAGDAQANELLLGLLAERRPGDAVLSEESADSPERLSADRVWIIDPLDGTREYGMPGRADWAVHVALWERGAPGSAITAAAVAQPALSTVYSTGRSSAMRRPALTTRSSW